ncbi:hypothetical protein Q31a_32010 [Aureliella helgolandensis]|uniref:Uncharacterized protein n=1 Tax=Aureliella helgolandensis TaxID=2527968 RepID=A0A518G8G9_9BACT|nr:hypothetical protein Q31a_32010 [Aureliella helgolandensis]
MSKSFAGFTQIGHRDAILPHLLSARANCSESLANGAYALTALATQTTPNGASENGRRVIAIGQGEDNKSLLPARSNIAISGRGAEAR